MPDKKAIQSYANYRKASRYMFKADVAVQLEYYEDIPFWMAVFYYARPKKHIKFYYADYEKGIPQSGKNVCLRYMPYADDALIVCVDSDFDFILQQRKLSVQDYVLQTYTYSWENHYCFVDSLQKRWTTLERRDFNFKEFINGFNKIVYPMLINVLTARANGIKGWSLLELCGKILHPSVSKNGALDNNGSALIKEIENEVNEWAKVQPFLDDGRIEQMKMTARPLGLTQETPICTCRAIVYITLSLGSGMNFAVKKRPLSIRFLTSHCALRAILR